MTEPVKPRRAYNSERRREAALQTRRRILDAATARFVEHGFAGTTIAAVAADASTAAETVYATFGIEGRRCSREVVSAAARGGDDAAILEQAGPARVAAAGDPSRAARAVRRRHQPAARAHGPAAARRRGRGAERARARRAAPAHPRGAPAQPARSCRPCSRARGALRLDEETAAETIWALASPELYVLLHRAARLVARALRRLARRVADRAAHRAGRAIAAATSARVDDVGERPSLRLGDRRELAFARVAERHQRHARSGPRARRAASAGAPDPAPRSGPSRCRGRPPRSACSSSPGRVSNCSQPCCISSSRTGPISATVAADCATCAPLPRPSRARRAARARVTTTKSHGCQLREDGARLSRLEDPLEIGLVDRSARRTRARSGGL